MAGAKLKPDLVWIRRDPGDECQKGVIDVKVTSTDGMNKSFKEKDDKYREWTTKETREKKGLEGGDGSPHHLIRRGGPQGNS